jgi:HD-GYP domain-containing protein (c-di-GMP phosphodiesterase class II)
MESLRDNRVIVQTPVGDLPGRQAEAYGSPAPQPGRERGRGAHGVHEKVVIVKRTGARNAVAKQGGRLTASTDLILEFMQAIESRSGGGSVDRLMGRILQRTRELTSAEAGTIFIVRGRGQTRYLEPKSIQNDVVRIAPEAFVVPINDRSIAGHVAMTGRTLIIDDLYEMPRNLPYRFAASFDKKIGYRSKSMMCFALQNFTGKVIGVCQLINRVPPGGGAPVPFDEEQAELIAMFNHLVGNAIERTDMLEKIRAKNQTLRARNEKLHAQRQQITDLQEETEEAFMLSTHLLAKAADIHDKDTGNHILRVNEYSHVLASRLGMNRAFCEEIRFAAQLHDVGKMSINSAILTKPGRLTPEERGEMEQHTVYGHEILKDNERLGMAAEIALNHHEQWAGGGYPNRVAGEDIPMAARIVAVADVYDALRSARPYKPGFSHEMAMSILLEGDDRIDPTEHFDPRLLDVLRNHGDALERVYRELAGAPDEGPFDFRDPR